ncbi:MAG: lamin tail domain-containing protein, partial [Anaerolineae bacterium]
QRAPPTGEAPLQPTAKPASVQHGVLIGEVLPGIHGISNNLEFIELYNAGAQIIDLAGWSLWYRMSDSKDEELLYAWGERADIPAQGHYLLVQAGQDVGNVADAQYTTSLYEKMGGLALRDANGETVDTLVWGSGPADYRTGNPAPVPEDGASLERLPGGDLGNSHSTGDDAADFTANPVPSPQNSGDPVSPQPEGRLALRLELPPSVEPGNEVSLAIEVQNLTGGTVPDLRALIPIPTGFEVISLPEGATESAGWVEWTMAELADGAADSGTILLQSPWTYLETVLRGHYVESEDGEHRAYGPLRPLVVEGGSIPIGTARTLEGQKVIVEGIATMYTGGFYAGSTGTKFYLEDESGGIQAYCPGGMGLVTVDVGDRVRVTGEIKVYRDSLEIVPSTYPDDVQVLEANAAEPKSTPATLEETNQDEELLGRLIVVEGTATRSEEFTYSFEVDLMDEEGNTLLVYVEKDTGVTTEPLDVGNLYRVTGIHELYSGNWQIKPRYQSDLAEVFPPELMLEMDAPNSVLPGETITYTLTVFNHTPSPLTNIRLEAAPPTAGISDAEVLDGGKQDADRLIWTIPELDADGGSATVRYRATVANDAAGQIEAEAATATADQWPDRAVTDLWLTFIGRGVPIWAIQGSGQTSPYVRNLATTTGIVIGVFPDLGGFWIQEAETDDDPATSAGLFVLTADPVSLQLGDEVRVSGKVRELSGQTLLELLDPADLEVISRDNVLPAPVELAPPIADQDALAYYEPLEGMLVQVTEPALAVGPTSKYGETPLVSAEWGIERVLKGDPRGMLIFLDDGGSGTHNDLSTLAFPLKSGDTLNQAIGPLAYTYDNYKIEPIELPKISPVERPLPALEAAGPNEFSIATFNVENLFDTREPHPSDPPRPSREQYELDLAKMVNSIIAMGAPEIVGLQEVENIGILEDLARQAALAEFDYQPFLIEGTDSRGIDNAYLVRGDRTTVEGAAAYPAPDGLTSRPPLVITTTVHLEDSDRTIYVLNNHFTSMSGGEKPTEPRRKAQAAWNVTLVERILAGDPDAHVVVLGDLNSFYESPPLDLLRDAGLRHVYEFVEPERPYTYIYQGESETLDHILVTPSLYELLEEVS